ncbi:hypothetical protein J422_01885 [Methanocaldococcus villosus KIN24-T80]|uniref:Uncharacterized protein n=1 Tax=Methanocaldococcus villosus KIN24-T80 TaxID=1069083 RepID=N6UW22_9EURY|nr:hypothetical protein [Methanocaldococcus villosus]ENN96524.1 hypothetical protein J422_01885 [Methanocaldococcus villosus KIN24-T80]
MYIVSFGVDIADNDVEANKDINDLVDKEVRERLARYGIKGRISNVTGDDIVITSLTPKDKLELNNKIIFETLKKYAKSFDDLNGVAEKPEKAKEGVSYAITEALSDYGDAIIVSFDTYGGEKMVNEMALTVKEICEKLNYNVDSSVTEGPKYIHGVGYTGKETDDPVVVIAVRELEDIKKLSCIIFGTLLSFDNLYFVKSGEKINILPPGVIYTMSAFLNGNIIDLYDGIKKRLII